MIIDIDLFLVALTRALDYAESELIGTMPHHAARVARITHRLMSASGHPAEQCYAAAAAALLHDCALKEYLEDEGSLLEHADAAPLEADMRRHCEAGEAIGRRLPFYAAVEGAILYHHERADGQGAFSLTADRVPDHSAFIHLADMADVYAGLYTYSDEKAASLRRYLHEGIGTLFTAEHVALFDRAVSDALLASLAGEQPESALLSDMSHAPMDISIELLREMSMIFADITDYKSHFTWRHSAGIAEKALRMGRYYGYDDTLCQKLYIAGLLHDIGKLCIPNSILEKPGRLDRDEYRTIQNHAMGTWELLKDISGLEDIARWAALHHEKTNGSGYPFGLHADQLGMNERLMACLDIYQALRESRPYKQGLSHAAAMEILNRMAAEGQLDADITADIDRCFGADPDDAASPAERPNEAPLPVGPAWRCPVCGYVYEGELPADLICPRCEQPASVFERVS